MSKLDRNLLSAALSSALLMLAAGAHADLEHGVAGEHGGIAGRLRAGQRAGIAAQVGKFSRDCGLE